MSRKHVCDIDDTKVTDSRPASDFDAYGHIRRRRVCRKCWQKRSTIEIDVAEYDQLTEAREFVEKLASFAEQLKENGTSSTTV